MRQRRPSLLRSRDAADSGKVGMVELFFDLVFVFAVTQLSRTLVGDLSLTGLMHVGLLLLGVWWVWIDTSWVTNWLDPERIPVRVALLALMLAGLGISIAIPKAFDAHGVLFALSYTALQIGRTLFFLWAVRAEPLHRRRNFQRLLVWTIVFSACWIAGATTTHDARLGWWALALAIESLAPISYFWVPGLGRSTIEDWDVEGAHLAERCALFIIIALGESLLVTGMTFAAREWDLPTSTGFANAVLGTILMWWIYFDTGAQRATQRIERADDPGREARSAYTYVHILIVGGIIASAVADELVIAHPHRGGVLGSAIVLGGPILYLLGNATFKWITNDRRAPPLSHLVGLGLLVLLAWPTAAHLLSPLHLAMLANGALLVVAIWESLAVREVVGTEQLPGE
ncbi:low temperature requirement protein A [Lysobacter sp. 2RAF19]